MGDGVLAGDGYDDKGGMMIRVIKMMGGDGKVMGGNGW